MALATTGHGEGLPAPTRRLRLGFVGGGRGGFIGRVHAMGARLSDRWDVVAGALSSDPERARQSGVDWMLPSDRVYSDYLTMAEREASRPDGIEAVAITTPNHTHKAIAAAFMERGIDVVCDKPLTNTVEEAVELLALQKRTGLVFGVTYSYSGHAMVRQARAMVQAGELGPLRQIHVEYAQDWAMRAPDEGNRGAEWRLDREKVGSAFTTADIGTHAHHLATFVTGLHMTRLRAEFHVCGAPKPLEDTAFMHVRYEGEVPGTLWVSQAAAGNHGGLRLRIYGERAGLEWDQEMPEYLRFTPLDGPARIIARGFGAGISPEVARLIRMPRGHPEGLADAWANLYAEFAVAVAARRSGGTVPDGLLAYPTVEDGARGVEFVRAAVESDAAGGRWTDLRLPLP